MVGERRGGPRWTVRSRIVAAILLVAVVGLGVTGSVTYLVQRERVARDVDGDLARQVEAARTVVADRADELTTTRDALVAILAVVLPPDNGSSIGIVDGRAALVPGSDLAFRLDDDAFVARVDRDVADGNVRLGTAVVDGQSIRYLAVPVVVDGAPDAGAFVVAIDLDREYAANDATFTVFAVVAAASVIAIGLVGWLVAGRLLRPVRTLRETAERITASDLGERIPVDGNDDVSRLTETVNDMLDRLDAALRGQRELLDDVRHELRTPLTIVRGHLELLDPSDGDDVRRTSELAIDEIDRMSALVDGLAALAEVRATVLDLRPVDVEQLTLDVADLASAIPGHPWRITDIATGAVLADRQRIVQALLQLADNAAKYSPAGSPIEIGSAAHADVVEFSVRDHGPGVPPGAEERIFERFARGERETASGSGLGLAIVDRIARGHGGSVRVESTGDGARFVLTLPRGGAS